MCELALLLERHLTFQSRFGVLARHGVAVHRPFHLLIGTAPGQNQPVEIPIAARLDVDGGFDHRDSMRLALLEIGQHLFGALPHRRMNEGIQHRQPVWIVENDGCQFPPVNQALIIQNTASEFPNHGAVGLAGRHENGMAQGIGLHQQTSQTFQGMANERFAGGQTAGECDAQHRLPVYQRESGRENGGKQTGNWERLWGAPEGFSNSLFYWGDTGRPAWPGERLTTIQPRYRLRKTRKHFGGNLILRIAAAFLLAMSLWGQSGAPGYGGPAVSSRGLRGAGSRAGEAVNIRPYASVRAVYDTGLITTSVNQQGKIVNPGGLFGVEAQVGAYGAKEWKRTRIGLDYEGLYRHYQSATFFNGTDHILDLDITRQATRRSYFRLRGLGGTSSRPVGGLFAYSFVDPQFLGVPSQEIFDNRTYFADAMGQYVINLSARNSVSFGGNGFAVRRRSKALIGMNGYRASGDFTRRISRRLTVGAGYQYLHFDFPRVFGESDIHMVMGEVAYELTRAWRLSIAGGAYRSDLSGIREVQLDPLVAALFGTSTGRQAFNAINYLPYAQAALHREYRRTSFVLAYNTGPSGGGGVFLTSKQQTAQVSWSYRGSDKWSFGLSGGYQDYGGLGAYQGKLTSYMGGATFTRRLTGDVFFSAGLDYRRFGVDNGSQESFKRNGSRAFSGITYSPGAIPLSIR